MLRAEGELRHRLVPAVASLRRRPAIAEPPLDTQFALDNSRGAGSPLSGLEEPVHVLQPPVRVEHAHVGVGLHVHQRPPLHPHELRPALFFSGLRLCKALANALTDSRTRVVICLCSFRTGNLWNAFRVPETCRARNLRTSCTAAPA